MEWFALGGFIIGVLAPVILIWRFYNTSQRAIRVEEDIKVEENKPTAGGCPGCGSLEYYEGPTGGSAMNVECVRCGRRGTVIFGYGEKWL
jgi:hypothetical protein